MVEAEQQIVAVVDDDQRVLESLGNLLEAAGHAVRVFASAAALLKDDALPFVGCLISDVGMPDTDGFELRRLIRVRRPDLPVILISGRVEMDCLQGSPRGGRRFFLKPFDSKELLASVSLALKECYHQREGRRRTQ